MGKRPTSIFGMEHVSKFLAKVSISVAKSWLQYVDYKVNMFFELQSSMCVVYIQYWPYDLFIHS